MIRVVRVMSRYPAASTRIAAAEQASGENHNRLRAGLMHIRRWMMPAKETETLTNQYSGRIARAIDHLTPFPLVAARLHEMCQNGNQDVSGLVELIECDSVLASRVLASANSPLYGYARQISSIQHAVVVLGFRNVSRLAISLASNEVFAGDAHRVTTRQVLFQHSVGCACVARRLCEWQPDVDADVAYLSGILHDIGKLVLMEIAEAEDTVAWRADGGGNQNDNELARFGVCHSQIGKSCAEKWGLPAELCAAIGYHHAPHLAPHSSDLAAVVGSANRLARHFGMGLGGELSESDWEAIAEINSDIDLEIIEADARPEFESITSACRP